MWKLYHHQIQQISELQNLLIESLSAYHRKDFHYVSKFEILITKLIDWTKSSNRSEILSRILIISSEFTHAIRGLDPQKLIKITTGRNDFKRIYFLKSVTSVEEILANEKSKIQSAIEEAKKDISTLVLSAIQSGSLDITTLANKDQGDVLAFWKSLNGSGDVIAIKSRISTRVGLTDIQLIILELFAKISEGLAV